MSTPKEIEVKDLNNFSQAHDSFFIRSMTNRKIAKDFLQAHLPKNLLKAVDLETIEICKDKMIDVNLKPKISDVLYRLKLVNTTENLYIATLIEHQSTPLKVMPLRVLEYEVNIMRYHWDNYKKVPIVHTLVYYNGQQKWHYSQDIKSLIQGPKELIEEYVLKPFRLIELNQIADHELREHYWAGIMSLAMKHIYDRDILPALRSFIDLLKEVEQAKEYDIVLSLLYYIYAKGNISDDHEFQTLIASELPKETGEKIMTSLAQKHIQQGLERGLEQGRQEGRQEGLQQGLQKLAVAAQKLLAKGMPIELVSEATEIDIQTLQKMKQKVAANKVTANKDG